MLIAILAILVKILYGISRWRWTGWQADWILMDDVGWQCMMTNKENTKKKTIIKIEKNICEQNQGGQHSKVQWTFVRDLNPALFSGWRSSGNRMTQNDWPSGMAAFDLQRANDGSSCPWHLVPTCTVDLQDFVPERSACFVACNIAMTSLIDPHSSSQQYLCTLTVLVHVTCFGHFSERVAK